jgi:hypothetical protein
MTSLDRLLLFLTSISTDPYRDALYGLAFVAVAAVAAWLVAEAGSR